MHVLDDHTVGTIGLGAFEVRRLGFGAMRISGARDATGARDRETARALVRRAVDRGVNLIDTADIYGYGESEEIIAEALHPYPDDVVIVTKAGFRPGKIEPGHVTLPPQGDPAHIKEACDGSLRRLRLEVIDVLLAHVPDPRIPYADTLGAFVELRDAGKIRHIGISNVTADQLDHATDVCGEIVAVQNRYNAGDRVSDAVITACGAQGVAFMPWAPILVGNAKAAAVLDEIADAHATNPQSVALRWLLHRSPQMLPIPGTSSIAHLDQNIDAAWLDLGTDEIERLDEAM